MITIHRGWQFPLANPILPEGARQFLLHKEVFQQALHCKARDSPGFIQTFVGAGEATLDFPFQLRRTAPGLAGEKYLLSVSSVVNGLCHISSSSSRID
jgi:hypothetical protein